MFSVTDEQFDAYVKRLSRAIAFASSYSELLKLKPSVVHAQRQATVTRMWSITCMLQDFTMKLKAYSIKGTK